MINITITPTSSKNARIDPKLRELLRKILTGHAVNKRLGKSVEFLSHIWVGPEYDEEGLTHHVTFQLSMGMTIVPNDHRTFSLNCKNLTREQIWEAIMINFMAKMAETTAVARRQIDQIDRTVLLIPNRTSYKFSNTCPSCGFEMNLSGEHFTCPNCKTTKLLYPEKVMAFRQNPPK